MTVGVCTVFSSVILVASAVMNLVSKADPLLMSVNVEGGSFGDTILTQAKREGLLISGTRLSDDSSSLYDRILSISFLEGKTLEYECFT
jgi:hypothetical protein